MSDIVDKLIPTDLEREMKTSFISYAMAVIINRALPDVRDGLKPVHRRILYAMNELGMTPDKPYRKSARIVGDVLGKYHPHGDSSVYEAMVRLAQNFNIRYMLVEGQGNFGSVDGDGAAAMRYTEARMSKLTMHLLGEIDKDTVDFYPNFDETLMQPTVLPSRFPNLLVNGSSGIAVGMATNIPPHNLREVVDGCVYMIDHPDCSVDDLMTFIKGPDFPTGGLILGYSGIRAAYHTGRGRILMRARTEIEAMPQNRQRIVVTEIPYMVNKAKLVEKIAELVHEKRVDGISDIRDESDRNGMRVVIELKRDVNPQVMLNTLYKHTQLQETFGVNMLALVDGEPKVLTLREMLYHYIRHQKEVVTRRTRYELDKAEARAHILEGLLKALDHIDEIVQIIKTAPDVAGARAALMERFQFSDKQAQAILDMRLARLTGLERDKLMDEYRELEKQIAYLQSLLNDEQLLLGVIKTEMSAIRDQFADERRTELTHLEGEIDIEDLIQADDMVVTMTSFGYIKRLPKSTYRAQHRGGRGVAGMATREEDFVKQLIIVNTHEEILFFTNRGRVYSLKCYQIPEAGRAARGIAIVNLLALGGDERVTAMIPVPRELDNHNVVMMTREGYIKKTPYAEFANLRKSGLIALTLNEGDELAGVELTDGAQTLLLGSRYGKAIRFNEADTLRPMGRMARGVHAMKLRENDVLIDMSVLDEGMKVLSITENGYGKLTDPDAYREQGRNGMGVKAMQLNDKTGLMVAQMAVREDEDVLLVTDDGTIIRMAAAAIRETGRNAQGVRLMRIAEGTKIVAVARAEQEQEDDATEDALEEAVEAITSEDPDVIGESTATAFDAEDSMPEPPAPQDDEL
ncbi:MAG: DNA gyrase subunit A [Candidatus Limiplasma sp.]|nr:DNA gyrase subunit A [Candidatus Limiplasma sp.]